MCAAVGAEKWEGDRQEIKDRSLRQAHMPLGEKALVKEPEKCAESRVRMDWGRLRRGVSTASHPGTWFWPLFRIEPANLKEIVPWVNKNANQNKTEIRSF